MKNIIKSSLGMTMVELLVAMVILATGILSIAGVVPLAMKSITKSRVLTKASEYNQQQIEILKKAGFNSLPTGAYTSTTYNPSGDTNYRQFWSVTANVNGVTSIRMVTVTTTWTPAFNDSISLVSYFTK